MFPKGSCLITDILPKWRRWNGIVELSYSSTVGWACTVKTGRLGFVPVHIIPKTKNSTFGLSSLTVSINFGARKQFTYSAAID